MERSTNADFPSLCDGNRVIKMILKKDLPYFLTVFGFECRLWYRDQPIQCFLCREHGHRAQACPLSGRCRRCHQPGHVARECSQAWGSVSRVAVHPVPEYVDPSSVPESASVPPVDPVDVSNVVTNISSVSEPAASETVPSNDAASSSASNSEVLGLNGAELFRQHSMTHRERIEEDVLERATEDLANAVSKISRDSFLKLSASGLEKFVVNAFRTKSFVKNSRRVMLWCLILLNCKRFYVTLDYKWNIFMYF